MPNNRSYRSSQDRAFTLIEIVISLAILSIVVGITYSALNNIVLTKEILDDRRDSDRIAGAIINRISRELQLAFSGIPLLIHPDTEKQTQLSSKINLVGIQGTLSNGEPGDLISFVALEGGQYLPDGGAHSGVVQITYRVAEDPEDPDSKTFYLVREEVPVMKPEEKAKEKLMVFPITKELLGLRFRYFDRENNEWATSWGSDNHLKLPSMVELQFKVMSPKGAVDTFTTAVALRSIY